jgi:hypothetical protein
MERSYAKSIASPPRNDRSRVSGACYAGRRTCNTCTLPPDLIERFLTMRGWYLEDHARYSLWSREFDKRFYTAIGLTTDQYRDVKYGDPCKKGLEAIWDRVSDESVS